MNEKFVAELWKEAEEAFERAKAIEKSGSIIMSAERWFGYSQGIVTALERLGYKYEE